MHLPWQDLIVLAAVVWAAWRVLQVIRGTLAQARTGSCGGGCGCAKSKDATADDGRPLVEISAAKRPGPADLPLAAKPVAQGQGSLGREP
jgi:hypothetical protein